MKRVIRILGGKRRMFQLFKSITTDEILGSSRKPGGKNHTLNHRLFKKLG